MMNSDQFISIISINRTMNSNQFIYNYFQK